jgi:hypothetical protein
VMLSQRNAESELHELRRAARLTDILARGYSGDLKFLKSHSRGGRVSVQGRIVLEALATRDEPWSVAAVLGTCAGRTWCRPDSPGRAPVCCGTTARSGSFG